ncbi:ROK family protein [uncultured Anaerococcus sp.]|uniref:ROK family protein n=1 Tax=uncultured Anaerococcus sp. TaxID=293428 RepID=UPI0025EBBCC3|nr:ROK family protein [uncultured Anaerococcus sp.]
MFGSIEFGGTKIRCAIFDKNGILLKSKNIKTNDPKKNLEDISLFFFNENIVSVGVGAFGPIEINNKSPRFGTIKNTPKLKWRNYNLFNELKNILNCDIELVTDVGLSAIGEYYIGAGKELNSLLYLTVGTGIGGAFIQNGKIVNGISHAEMGHIEISREKNDTFDSVCPYHKNCLEGLASGPSIEKRTHQKAEFTDVNDIAFEYASIYIAKALYTYSLILRPHIIIIGGGLSNKKGFINKIKNNFNNIKGEYITIPKTDDYIKTPYLNNDSALYGGYILAKSIH